MAETEERHGEEIGEAQREMKSTADEMAERSDELGRNIDGAKKTLSQAQNDPSVPTASSDWEDTEPDSGDDGGGDAAGFDDPENLDDEDDDYEDDEDE